MSKADHLHIVFTGDDTNKVAYNVIWKIRLPRLALGSLLGGASTVDLLLSDGKRKPRKDPIPVTGRRTYGVRGIKLPEGVTVTAINKRK